MKNYKIELYSFKDNTEIEDGLNCKIHELEFNEKNNNLEHAIVSELSEKVLLHVETNVIHCKMKITNNILHSGPFFGVKVILFGELNIDFLTFLLDLTVIRIKNILAEEKDAWEFISTLRKTLDYYDKINCLLKDISDFSYRITEGVFERIRKTIEEGEKK